MQYVMRLESTARPYSSSESRASASTSALISSPVINYKNLHPKCIMQYKKNYTANEVERNCRSAAMRKNNQLQLCSYI